MPYHRKTTPKFAKEAKRVHGEEFDYSEVKYVNTHTPVRIKHKRRSVVFIQCPVNHLVGHSSREHHRRGHNS